MIGSPSGMARPGPSAERLTVALRIIDEIIVRDSIYCSAISHPAEFQRGDVEIEFSMYLPKVIDQISELFSAYTGHDCAVCIKALNRTKNLPNLIEATGGGHDGDAPYVYTFQRDSVSQSSREQIDRALDGVNIYRHELNTGLTLARQHGFWFDNDLIALGEEYKSGNPDWQLYYNATAIVILAFPSEGKAIEPHGFLCVDNKHGEFDGESCRYILEILANILHYSMRMTLSASMQEGGKG